MSKIKPFKSRNPYAKDVLTPKYGVRIKPDKKKNSSKKIKDKEIDDFTKNKNT